MAVGRKDRLISFRISEEEYQGLRSFCDENGIRNLSEFARSAVGHRVDEQIGPPASLSTNGSSRSVSYASDLNDTMLRLTQAVTRLSLLIEQKVNPSNLPGPTSSNNDRVG